MENCFMKTVGELKEFIKLIMNYESLKAEVNDLERYNLDSSNKREELFLLKYLKYLYEPLYHG